MNPDTWALIGSELNEAAVLRGRPVSREEIDRASAVLDTPFPSDYSEFLERYGGAVIGALPVFGLQPVEAMGNPWSVVEINERYRAEGLPGIDEWLVISVDQAGNPIGILPDGSVWIWDHDFGGPSELATDFENFLRQQLTA